MQIYLVGGAVRDQLLNITVKDKDFVVVGATQDEMLRLGYEQVGKDFPVFLHPQTKAEYALARTERKVAAGYTGFECYAAPDVTLEEDLQRRDLTINAIVQDSQGNIIDLTHGRADLENRMLRHISPSFTEDPLRVLRVARFAARFHYLGFTIAEETLTLMRQMTSEGELASLTPERIWKEVEKTLTTRDPQVFFTVLREIGALAVVFPDIDCLFGIPAPKRWHPEIDTGIHTLMVLEQAALLSPDIGIRLAALLHDLGKAKTPPEKWPSHHGHGQLGLPVIKAFCQRYKIPNEYRDLAMMVSEQHTNIHNAMQLKPATIVKIFDKTDAWRKPERFKKLLVACTADVRGRLGFSSHPYPEANYMTAMLEQALSIAVKPIVEAGYCGANIKQELTRQRINALARLKNRETQADGT